MPLYLPKVSCLWFVAFYCCWYWVDVLHASGIIIPHELLRFLFFMARNFGLSSWSPMLVEYWTDFTIKSFPIYSSTFANVLAKSTFVIYFLCLLISIFRAYSKTWTGLRTVYLYFKPNLNWFLSTRNALISWQISFHKTSLNKISFSHTNCLLSLLDI